MGYSIYSCTPQKCTSLYEYHDGGPKRIFQEEVVLQCYYTNKLLECCKHLCGKVVTWMIALELYYLALLRTSYIILCNIHTIPTVTNGHTIHNCSLVLLVVYLTV